MAEWEIGDAKHRLDELLERARAVGPQVITHHGKERAVVLSVEDYRKLEAAKPNFKEHLLSGPLVDDFEIERPRDLGRVGEH